LKKVASRVLSLEFMVITLLLYGSSALASMNPAKASYFIESHGQSHLSDEILFVAHQGNNSLFFRKGGLSYVKRLAETNGRLRQHRIDLNFIDAHSDAELHGQKLLSSFSTFYHSHEHAPRARHYEALVYKNVYPDIDLRYFFTTDGAIKYEFIVHSGANPNAIKIEYTGLDSPLAIDEYGSLLVSTELGIIEEKAPYSFQKKGKEIHSSYQLEGNVLSFQIGQYDSSEDLVIDPYLVWSTYLGGSLGDVGTALATDSTHYLYVLGHTLSNNFPKTLGAHQDTLTGNSDLFISKFDTLGQLVWSTYFGGLLQEQSNDISVSPGGDVYVLATTLSGTSIPVSDGVHQKNHGGESDAFLIRLDASGQWKWASYFGGSKNDYGSGLQVNASGTHIYVAGYTESNDFYTSVNAQQKNLKDSTDGFVAQFDSSGKVLWSTYLGGSRQDRLNDICLDPIGRLYLTGTSSSKNFPILGNSHQDTLGGKLDAVVLRLSSKGILQWSTFFGSTENETGVGIAVTDRFQVCITGDTESKNLLVRSPYAVIDTFSGGGTDIFVAGFKPYGPLSWSRFYGGTEADHASSIDWYHTALVVSGNTKSDDLYMANFDERILRLKKSKGTDGFMLNLDTTIAGIINTTYVGGNDHDSLCDAIFYFGGQATTGSTKSTDYTTLKAVQNSKAGQSDVLLTTLCPDLFKRISSGCREDGNTGTIFADSFKDKHHIQYKWHVRTEFSQWKNIPKSNRAYLPSRAFVQDMFYRREYTSGMCTDTSLKGKFIFDATPSARMLLEDSFCFSDTMKPRNATTIAYGNFTSSWSTSVGSYSGFETNFPLKNTSDTIVQVHLTAVSDSHCIASTSRKVFVKGTRNLHFLYNQNCIGYGVSFKDTFRRRNSEKLVWNFGDGSQPENEQQVLHTYPGPGSYKVVLYGLEGPGCIDSFSKTIKVDSSLKVHFTASNSCITDSVIFRNGMQHGLDSIKYKWFFGDGSSDSSKNASHLYAKEGQYTARLVISKGVACSDSFSRDINILAAPKALPTYSKNCNEPFIRFKTNPVSQSTDYQFVWKLGDGTTRSDSLNFKHTYSNVGKYQVEVIASIDSQNCTDTARFEVQNLSTLEARFKASVLCEGDSTQFTDSSSYTGILQSRKWNFGDGGSSSKKFPRHSFNKGSYKVSLIIQSDSGCIDTFSKNITITEKPVAQFTIPAGCIGTDIQMKDESYANGDSITNWHWNFGSGITSNRRNPTHRFNSEGLYEIELIVQTNNQCTDTLMQIHTQAGLPSATLIESRDVRCKGEANGSLEVLFTDGQGSIKGQWSTNPSSSGKSISNLKAGEYSVVMTDSAGCKAVQTFEVVEPDSLKIALIPDKVICEYKRTQVKAFTTGGNNNYKYEWNCTRKKCNINGIGVSEVTLSPRYNTTYTVFATDEKGCRSNTREFSILTLPTLQVNAGPDIVGIAGREIQLNATADTVCDFSWSPANVLNDHEIQNPLATLNTTTRLTVQASSPDRCPSTDVVTITIVDGPSFANAFTPNNDGVNDVWEIRGLDLFPDAQVDVYNRWGALLFTSKDYEKPWDGTYNGNDLPEGAYYYIIDPGSGIDPYTGDVTILK